MPYSTIIVQRKDGSPVHQAKVALGFSHLLSSGLSKSKYTDKHGQAIIEHRNTGEADVYVNGKKMKSFNSPGDCVITL